MDSVTQVRIIATAIAFIITIAKEVSDRKYKQKPLFYLKEAVIAFLTPLYIWLLVYIMTGKIVPPTIGFDVLSAIIIALILGIFISSWMKSYKNWKKWICYEED